MARAKKGPDMPDKGWVPATATGHPLSRLDGKTLGGRSLQILIGPRTRYGADYFEVLLRDEEGNSSDFILLALFHSGPYPGYNWIEVIKLVPDTQLAGQYMLLSETDIELLFGYLSGMIPPGGHIMVEYESELWSETRNALDCGIPPVLTPLGFLMFKTGCGTAFKDWYFAEGGSEGPRKLQGHKALNQENRVAREKDIATEIQDFTDRKATHRCRQVWSSARKRGKDILAMLDDQ
jgi:hypothetical protein